MGVFPFFRDITGKDVLIVGGGNVALRRAQVLLEFDVKLRVVSPVFAAEFDGIEAVCIHRAFAESDLEGVFMVIAAADDHEVNTEIAHLCLSRGIEINVSDSPELSTFQFPGIVRRGGMTVAVNSGGMSPTATALVCSRLRQIIPDDFEEILLCMEQARKKAKSILSQQCVRKRALEAVMERCLQPAELLPDLDEIESIIRQFLCRETD